MRPFSNVVEAKGRHIGWLQELFQEYQLAVPEEGAAVHVVLPDSLEAAIEAGVQAELDNIGMYESFLTRDLPADVREVFERLEGASKNHLQAFRRQAQRFN
jgi:rubrerythrin